MNYRHAFHAGNHADCLKHAALCVLLDYLRAKDKPLFMLDTHAGRGTYDLTSAEALRSGEFRYGIARLLGGGSVPKSVRPYLDAVQALNAGPVIERYPGSPALVARALRPQDRLIACELSPPESSALTRALGPSRQVRIETRDGYGALKAFLPPPERRGLVLIDPPFEQANEFAQLAQAMRQAWKRWPSGVYLIWYPIKDRAAVTGFQQAVVEAGIADVSVYELFVRAPSAPGMNGSGLLTVNASFALDAAMREMLPFLAERLAQGPGAAWRAERLSPE